MYLPSLISNVTGKFASMNFAVVLCLFYILLLANSGLSKRSKRLHGEYYYTVRTLTGNNILQINGTEFIKVPFKPCHKHLKIVERTKTPPRTFIPLCDEDGFYAPLQCDSSSGVCWCVDRIGKERAKTRKKGLADCGLQSVQQPCRRHRLRALLHRGLITSRQSYFVPQCDKDGFYLPLQCLVRDQRCWCVDKHGKEIAGTRRRGTVHCEAEVKVGKLQNRTYAFTANKPCFRHQERRKWITSAFLLANVFNPSCDEEGYYNVKQCYAGDCWCADRNGKMIAGTKQEGDTECESGVQSWPVRKRCFTERVKALKTSLSQKPFIPLCGPDGYYTPLQCDTFKGVCWCVDRDGREIDGSRTTRTPNCLKVFEAAGVRPCQIHRWYIQQLPATDSIHLPTCKDNGFFHPVQCNRSNHCWCVKHDGTEVQGSATHGKPHCSDEVEFTSNKPCSRHKAKRKKIIPLLRQTGVFNPSCDEEGYYDVKQCYAGSCWCADRNGKIIAGTRKIGDVECGEKPLLPAPTVRGPCAERLFPLKNLESDRESYLPVCDEKGFYASRQCSKDSSFCWCVDRYGSVMQGTDVKGMPTCGGERKT